MQVAGWPAGLPIWSTKLPTWSSTGKLPILSTDLVVHPINIWACINVRRYVSKLAGSAWPTWIRVQFHDHSAAKLPNLGI